MKRTTFKQAKMIQYDVNQEPIILSKYLLDTLLRDPRPTEVIALYAFYYYTAKWQDTKKLRATTNYTAKALHWTDEKVRSVKHRLKALGLIEDLQQRDADNTIKGHYIKLNIIFSTPPQIPEGGNVHTVDSDSPNAFINNNLNAFNTNNLNIKKTIQKKSKEEPNILQPFLDMFPKQWRLNTIFQEAIKDYIGHRKEIKSPLTIRACKKIANKCDKYPSGIIIEAINRSIENGWTGLFPESIKQYTKKEYNDQFQEQSTVPSYVKNLHK